MPGRKTPLITDEIYHVFNRGIARGVTFEKDAEYVRAVTALSYYSFSNRPYSLSRFFRFDAKKRMEILKSLYHVNKSVQVYCFCLMPNHFHLLLKQNIDGGISKFLGNFQNSYTRYFNTIHDRDGSLFLNQFKAVRIENEEQLIHVSRYIHLNPFVASIVSKLDNLPGYPWSSYMDYVEEGSSDFVETEMILGLFKDKLAYRKFVDDEAEYRRNLKRVEHLLFDFG